MKLKSIQILFFALVILVVKLIIPQQLFAEGIYTEVIESIIPPGWELVETKDNEIPWGHYWGQEYKGKRGKLLVFRGPTDVQFNWQDRNENWHKISLAKEVLEIWIMPPGYHESWKRFFNIHRPQPAVDIFESNSTSIFAHPTHRITDESKFKELLNQAKTTSWPESPHNGGKISWTAWEADLAKALSDGKNK